MKRTTIAQLYQMPNNYKDIDITVCGWIRSLRDSKSLAFIDLNDGSCFKGVQIVFEETTLSNYKEIAKQNVGTALCVTGTFILTPDAKQPFELHAKQIYVEGASSPEYPLQKKRHSLEYLRTIAHLRHVPIPIALYFVFDLPPPLQFINSFKHVDFYMLIPPSLQEAIVKAQEKCSVLQH